MSAYLEQARAFAYYNRAFNEAVYDAAERLSDDDRRADRGAFFGSIHRTLGHILLADRIWLARFAASGVGAAALQGAALITDYAGLDDDLYPAWVDLRRERRATDEDITRFAAALTDDDAGRTMRYANSKGIEREHLAWPALAHFFNHQTHHRGQVTTLLYQAGVDPGVTDLLAWLPPA